ncbi:hypothetical protein [Dactylosporangium sp. CA-092794]|uniref:hypothetical protein n=1 Tax=Dactylosporangium sp. CA-092794 TaxID=3239929 RepID=UPI003D94E56E
MSAFSARRVASRRDSARRLLRAFVERLLLEAAATSGAYAPFGIAHSPAQLEEIMSIARIEAEARRGVRCVERFLAAQTGASR